MKTWTERRDELELISCFAFRYHLNRRDFLDRMAKMDPVLSLFFGSAAFTSLAVGWNMISGASALAVVAYSAMNLSFGYASCSAKHAALLGKWSELRKKIWALQTEDEAALCALEQEREGIDADSPAQLYVLSSMCEDEEKIARGWEPYARVPWRYRFFSNFFSMGWYRPKVVD